MISIRIRFSTFNEYDSFAPLQSKSASTTLHTAHGRDLNDITPHASLKSPIQSCRLSPVALNPTSTLIFHSPCTSSIIQYLGQLGIVPSSIFVWCCPSSQLSFDLYIIILYYYHSPRISHRRCSVLENPKQNLHASTH
jgi:hypothetical protein